MILQKTIENIRKRKTKSLNDSPFHNQHYLINIIENAYNIANKKRQIGFSDISTYTHTGNGFIYTPYVSNNNTDSIFYDSSNYTTRTTTSSDWTISSRYYNEVNNSYYGTITLTSISNNTLNG